MFVMPYYLWGAIGAAAPEIVRWYSMRFKGLGEWARLGYWLATGAYVALGSGLADLVANHTPAAAFTVGIGTELSILGGFAIVGGPLGRGVEEFEMVSLSLVRRVYMTLREHAVLLMYD